MLSISPINQKVSIDGESLVPLIFEDNNKYNSEDGYSFSCSTMRSEKSGKSEVDYYWKGVEIDKTKFLARNHICSLQNNEFKYILNEDGNDEFYDLGKDPLEKSNLIDVPSEEKDKMRRILLNKIDTFSSQNMDMGTQMVDEQYFKVLEQEGYMR